MPHIRRLIVVRLFGAAAALLLLVPIARGALPWTAVLLCAVDLFATWLMRYRRWRFPIATWFGCVSLLGVLAQLDGIAPSPWTFAAAALSLATSVSLVWPRLEPNRPKTETIAYLPPLPGSWALLSTLVLVFT